MADAYERAIQEFERIDAKYRPGASPARSHVASRVARAPPAPIPTVLRKPPLDVGDAGGSSRAVLSALRALQDKIKRLEGERSRALDECKALRGRLEEQEQRLRQQRELDLASTEARGTAKLAYERVLSEKDALERRAAELAEQKRSLAREVEALRDAASEADAARRSAEAEAAAGGGRLGAAEEELEALRAEVSALKEDLSAAQSGRAQAEAARCRLDDFCRGVLSINEALVRSLPSASAAEPPPRPRRKAALDTGAKRRTAKKGKGKPPARKRKAVPFLPAGGRRPSHNVLAAVSEAVSEAYLSDPTEALHKLHERLGISTVEADGTASAAAEAVKSLVDASARPRTPLRPPAPAFVASSLDLSTISPQEEEPRAASFSLGGAAGEHELLGVEAMLQEEHEALERRYKALLQAMRGGAAGAGAARSAEELADVIRSLARKQKELELLRRSVGASARSSPQRSSADISQRREAAREVVKALQEYREGNHGAAHPSRSPPQY